MATITGTNPEITAVAGTTGAKQLAPKFSADGTKMAFHVGGGVFVGPTTGGDATLIAYVHQGFDLSPDGSVLARIIHQPVHRADLALAGLA